METVKNRIMVLMLLAVTTLLLAACSSSDNGYKTADLDKLADDIMSGIQFSDELIEMKYPTVGDFYTIDESKLKSSRVFKSASGATAEEFALFEAAEPEYVSEIKDAISERIEDLKFGFESYVPEEMKKLEDAVIYADGSYVFLGISDDAKSMRHLFEQALK